MSIKCVQSKKCTGCYVCSDSCPFGAISMMKNTEGFFMPAVDEVKCVDCHICEKKCPALTENGGTLGKFIENGTVNAYVIKCNDDKTRFNSSSGGVFPVIAEKFISEGGIVCGAAFDEKWHVHHIFINSVEEIRNLQSSKYVQSDMLGIYSQVGELLKEGKKVMFTGTPCQTAALSNYLSGFDKDRLLLVDLFCHGVSSPGLFELYLKEIINTDKIESINFRYKGDSWERYRMRINYDDKVYSKPYTDDPFLLPFCRSVSLRESCYSCKSKGFPRHSDLTLGDFWMIDRIMPKENDHKGMSLVLVNTENGKTWINKLTDMTSVKNLPTNALRQYYMNSGKPVIRPASRDVFFERLKTEKLCNVYKQVSKRPIKQRVITAIRNFATHLGVYGILKWLKEVFVNGEK